MTTQAATIGQSTQGKPINLAQLQTELHSAGIECATGLGSADGWVFPYAAGEPTDFPVDQQATVDQVIADHVAMRDKTDVELAAEFQDPNTTPARKQDIRDMQSGLLPREQVPM